MLSHLDLALEFINVGLLKTRGRPYGVERKPNGSTDEQGRHPALGLLKIITHDLPAT